MLIQGYIPTPNSPVSFIAIHLRSETMSAFIVGAIKITFGLISKKICAFGANKLHNGGLFDRQFRDLIVSELADIKLKVDALSQKELSSGISWFDRGVDRLGKCFETSSDSVDGIGRSQTRNAIEKHSLTSITEMLGIEQELTIAHAVGNLKNIANDRYERAEESFKNAAKDAGMAFCNPALDIKNRILACKVRIASEILGNLTDPDLAANDCVGYLKELHRLPSIVAIFDEQASGGVKRRISSAKRTELIESVIMINLSLLNFILNFAKKEKNSYVTFDSWPLIVSGTTVYHPLYYEVSNNIMQQVTPPWCIRTNPLLDHYNKDLSVVNSKGDVIRCPNPTQNSLQKLDRHTGELQILTKGNKEDIQCISLAVDEDDTVYLLVCLWDTCNKTLKDKLQKYQNRAARIIAGASYEIRSADVLQALEWEDLESRRIITKATLMYKILNDYSAPNLKKLFKRRNSLQTSYALRNSQNDLDLPKPRREFLKKSFKYSGSRLWNNLSLEAKEAQSICLFKDFVRSTNNLLD